MYDNITKPHHQTASPQLAPAASAQPGNKPIYTKRNNKMTTATKLREIRDGGEAEYQLNPPITLTIIGEAREITHVISSHAYAMRAGIMEDETMIFQSDGNGEIVRYAGLHLDSWVDLYYMPGHVDHDEAVRNFLEENTHE